MSDPISALSNTSLGNLQEIAAEIAGLETMLGLPNSKPTLNIGRARARRQELLGMVARRPAQTPVTVTVTAPAAKGIDLPDATAICTIISSRGETESILRNDNDFSYGLEQQRQADAAKVAAENKFGRNSPAAITATENAAKLSLKLKAERAGAAAAKLLRLTKKILSTGVNVPGLSVAGLAIDPNGNPDAKFSPRQRAHAEQAIREYLAAKAGDPVAIQSNTEASRLGLEAFKAANPGRVNAFGQIILS